MTIKGESNMQRPPVSIGKYQAEKQGGNSEPWKNLQVRLGHINMETTTNTHQQVTREFEAQMSERAARELADILIANQK